MRFIRVSVAALTALVFSFNISFTALAYEASTVKVLTLHEVKELAKENNPDIKLQKVEIELARIEERDSWVDYDQARVNYQNNYYMSTYKTAMEGARALYEMAVYTNADSKVALENLYIASEYDAENLCFNILATESVIKALEKSVQNQGRMVDIETLKSQLGLSNKYLIEEQLKKARELTSQLESMYNTRDALYMQIKRMIGFDYDRELQILPVIIEPVAYNNKYETEKEANETALAIKQFNRTIQDKKDDIEINKYDASDTIEKLNFEIDKIELLKEKTEYNTKLAVKTAFDTLHLAQQKLIDSQAAFLIASSNLESTKLQLELGLISNIGYAAQEINYMQAENVYQRATYDYYLTAREVELAGKGILLSGK